MKLINVTVKTIKVLEKYTSLSLCDLGVGNYNNKKQVS